MPIPSEPTAKRPVAPDSRIADPSRAGDAAQDIRVQARASSKDSPRSSDHPDSGLVQWELQWVAEMGEHPDAIVRLHALDLMAHQPADALDPVAYALLEDDDVQVRDRAQAFWEQQLAQPEQVNEEVEW